MSCLYLCFARLKLSFPNAELSTYCVSPLTLDDHEMSSLDQRKFRWLGLVNHLLSR